MKDTIEVETWYESLCRFRANTTMLGAPATEWVRQGEHATEGLAKKAARSAIDSGSQLEWAIAEVRREVMEIIR